MNCTLFKLQEELADATERLNSEDRKNREICDTIEEQKRKISGLQMSLNMAEDNCEEKAKLTQTIEDLQSELNVSILNTEIYNLEFIYCYCLPNGYT